MPKTKIEITLLGKFAITVNGQPALPQLAQSRKAMLMVQYLLLKRDTCIPHKELIDALWGSEVNGNPDMALRAIMHRYRVMAADTALENSIQTNRGTYQWNNALNCNVDMYTMRNLLAQVSTATRDTQKMDLYERALALYTGKLLPASASEAWVERRSVQLHTQYRAALFSMVELCKAQGDHARVVQLCRRALDLDAYDERVYMELIVALEQLGDNAQAREVASLASERGCMHINESSHRVTDAYKQMRRAEITMESDVEKIAGEVCGSMAGSEAYLCEYAAFREIFAVQMRVFQRYGMAPYLALVTITPPADQSETARTETMMGLLGDALRECLRHSDVVARYSATQYVLLLFGGSGVMGSSPMERIKAAFYANPANEGYVLTYRLHTPESGLPPASANDEKRAEKAKKKRTGKI